MTSLILESFGIARANVTTLACQHDSLSINAPLSLEL